MQDEHNQDPVNTNRFHSGRRSGKTDLPVRPHLAKALDSGDPNEVFDCLTGKQKAFVEEYMKDLNGTAAVIRCGYKTKGANANRIASRLLQNPGVRFAIDALKAERNKNSDVTADYVLREIVKIVESTKSGNPNAALRGLELLGKHMRLFIDRQEITGNDGEAIKYEKVKQDADAFTSAIASLAARAGKREMALLPDPGDEGGAEVELGVLGTA